MAHFLKNSPSIRSFRTAEIRLRGSSPVSSSQLKTDKKAKRQPGFTTHYVQHKDGPPGETAW